MFLDVFSLNASENKNKTYTIALRPTHDGLCVEFSNISKELEKMKPKKK